MKYIIQTFVFALFALASAAQNDPKAEAILNELSQKTKAYKTLKATFVSELVNKQADLRMEQNGTIQLKGDQYVLDLDDYRIITNGTTTWTYAKEDMEVYVDNNADVQDESSIKPSEIFTIWESGFKYKYGGEETIDGELCHIIKLFPKDPESRNFHTLVLAVSKSDKTLKKITALGKSGENYTYLVKSITPNVALNDQAFTFNKADYPGVDVIDNR